MRASFLRTVVPVTPIRRPIRSEDAGLLVEFYARVSDESKYFRFFAPRPELAAKDVARLVRQKTGKGYVEVG